MFNTYSNNQIFSYNINAVSGTLRKSHPKSRFFVSKIERDLAVFNPSDPQINFGDTYPVFKDIIILQIMLCGDNKAIVEFVEAKDFVEERNISHDDVAPVVYGHWIPTEYDGYADGYPVWGKFECSVCGCEHYGEDDTLTNYCPDCGAKMDLQYKIN